MSGPLGSSTWFGTPSYDLDNSLRIGSAAASGLARFGNDSRNGDTFTISFWVKRSILGTAQILVTSKTESAGVNSFVLTFTAADKIQVLGQPEDGTTGADSNRTAVLTTAVFRDTSAWYHIVYRQDTTQGTASNRHKLYVNGVLQSLATNNALDQNTEWKYFYNANNYPYAIANDERDNSYADFYMAEHHYTDGVSNGPEAFGETGVYGEWKPIVYAGSHGTYGHYLKFNQTGAGSGTTAVGGHDYTTGTSSTIGADSSGNDHHFHVQGYATHDHVPDSPTNNFATLNPLDAAANCVISEGNLKYTTDHSAQTLLKGTFNLTNKHYWEVSVPGVTGDASAGDVGIANPSALSKNGAYATWAGNTLIYTGSNGNKSDGFGGSSASYGAAYTTGDIVGIAVDVPSGTIQFFKNNASQGTITDSTITTQGNTNTLLPVLSNNSTSGSRSFIANFGQDSSFAGTKTAQGNQDGNGIGDFFYAPPSGFLALCTENLPEPTVDPRNHFNTILHTTANAASITGVGFQPDLVWSKARANTYNHGLFDSVRGATSGFVISNDAAAEVHPESGFDLLSFDSDGFTTGNNQHNVIAGGVSYVTWNWKAGAGNTAFSESGNNPAGTHRANVAAGFSIVSYVGTGAAGTVAHGLGAAPELMLIKNRDVADEWYVYYGDNTDYLVLDDTDATADNATAWNDTSPSSTVFTVNTSHSVNADAEKYIAYCWRSIEGFSKVGSYTGTGAVDGIFNYTGFRPAWVMIKRTDATNYWLILDDARPYGNPNFVSLYANLNDVENTFGNGTGIDFVSNGFKHRDNVGSTNADGGTYIFLAFADSPFKYSNGK